jgi:hypothetical protein
MNILTFAEKNPSFGSWAMGFVRGAISLIQTVVSAVLLLISMLFFILVNQKQKEFDSLDDQIKKS